MSRPPRPLRCCTPRKTVARLRSQRRSDRLQFRLRSCRVERRSTARRRPATHRWAQTPQAPQITDRGRKRRIGMRSSKADRPGAAGSRNSAIHPAGCKIGHGRRRRMCAAPPQPRRLSSPLLPRFARVIRQAGRRPGSGRCRQMCVAPPPSRSLKSLRPLFVGVRRRAVHRLGSGSRRCRMNVASAPTRRLSPMRPWFEGARRRAVRRLGSGRRR